MKMMIRKKWGALLLASLMLLGAAATVGATASEKEIAEIVSYDSFDDKAAGTQPTTSVSGSFGWARYSRGTHGVFKEVDGETVMSFETTQADVASGEALNPAELYYVLKKNESAFEGYTGQFAVELKMRSDKLFNADVRLVNNQHDGLTIANTLVYSYFTFDGTRLSVDNIEQLNEDGTVTNNHNRASTSLRFNEWAVVRYEINTDTESFDLYVNDVLLLENAKFFIKDIAGTYRTEAQKTNNIAFIRFNNALIGNQITIAELQIDDVAVYDTAKPTKYYYGAPTVPEFSCAIGDTLRDAKIGVPVLDSSGVDTDKTVKTVVRLSRLDSSVAGIQLAGVDNAKETARMNIVKTEVTTPAFRYAQGFDEYITDVTNHTVTTDENDTNKYMRIGNSDKWERMTNLCALNCEGEFDVSFRVRFACPAGLEWSNGFFSMQLKNDDTEIISLLFAPETTVLRYNIPEAEQENQALLEKAGVQVFPSCDPTKWYDVKLHFENNQVSVTFDNKQALFGGLNNSATATVAGTFNRIDFAHRGTTYTTALTDIDDITITAPEVTGVVKLASIPEQKHILTEGGTLPTTVTGSLTDGTPAVYPIASLTQVEEATSYTAEVIGYDTPVTVIISWVTNPFVLEAPYVDSETNKIAVPVTKVVTDNASGTLLLAAYGEDDVLKAVTQVAVHSSGNILTDIAAENGDTAKAFIWNDMADLRPLAEMEFLVIG